MAKLQGAFTALVTPMFEDGSINYEGWRKLIQLQLEGGISGLVPLGTTGETPTLEESPEEEKLIEIVVSEVKQYKEKLAKELNERKSLKIRFCKDDYTVDTACSIIREGDSYYLNLSLIRGMVRYINDRFVDIEIIMNDRSGLKIPQSAITSKEF